jgi:hypothetical protein
MSDQKHTAGPWAMSEARALDGEGWAYEIDTPEWSIAHVFPHDDMEANACLIAAAPELLAALGAILTADGIDYWGEGDTAMQNARAAIAKATQ